MKKKPTIYDSMHLHLLFRMMKTTALYLVSIKIYWKKLVSAIPAGLKCETRNSYYRLQCSRCGRDGGVLASPLFGCVCENFQCVWEIFECVSAKIQFTPEGEYRRSLQSYPPPWPSLLKNQPKLFFSVLWQTMSAKKISPPTLENNREPWSLITQMYLFQRF